MNKYTYYWIGGALALLVMVGIFAYQTKVYRTEISQFALSATMSDAAGVALESKFVLTSTADLSPQVLEKYIRITPQTAFSVNKISGTSAGADVGVVSDPETGSTSGSTSPAAQTATYEIVPLEPLTAETVYTISIDKGPIAPRDFSWAYQVKAPFQILSTLPRDKATSVPLNSGIEIDFNRENIAQPENFISISPAVAGRFEVAQSKVRFIPTVPFNEKALYTITVRKGLGAKETADTLKEDVTIQFETQDGRYRGGNERAVYFNRTFSEFKPGDPIGFALYGEAASAKVAVYSFASVEDYQKILNEGFGLNSWRRHGDNLPALLSKQQTYLTATLPLEKIDYAAFLRLPQLLPTGFYAVVLSTDSNTDVAWFQVNAAASFSAYAAEKSVVWLKNIDTEQAIPNVPLYLEGRQIGITAADGVALFDTPPELVNTTDDYQPGTRKFLIARTPETPLLIPIENNYGSPFTLNKPQSWWATVSLNKNQYLPDDTVRFWSILKKRDGSAPSGPVKVVLTKPYWEGDGKIVTTYAQMQGTISQFGALTGELPFTDLNPGYYQLTFKIGDETIAQSNFEVATYVKPAYRLSITPDRSAAFDGDPITFKVRAEFFDGTPVGSTSLTYNSYGGRGGVRDGQVSLNEHGEGSFTIVPAHMTTYANWYGPSLLNVAVRPSGAEEGVIENSTYVYVFNSRVHNQITQERSGNQVIHEVFTRQVSLPQGLSSQPFWDVESYLGGHVVGSKTSVSIVEVQYVQTQIGTGYDPINKVTYPRYNYTVKEIPVSTQTITTDGSGRARVTFTPESRKVYKFIFKTPDGFGGELEDVRYHYSDYSGVYASLSEEYDEDESYYSLSGATNETYSVGERIDLVLRAGQSGQSPLPGNSKFIFLTVHNGDMEYVISNSPEYHDTFNEKDIPNISVWTGWFSKGRFRNAGGTNLSFDSNDRRLTVNVTPNKTRYVPGEEVELNVSVVDKTGKPVRAEINLSALDEAVFSINPSEQDLVNSLYQDIYSSVIIRSSNARPYGGGGAEKGGGGDDAARSDIREMALYKSVETDSSGRARVSFKLPDNITSWRITSQAVTKDLYAGKNVSFLPVSLPFFVDATLNESYLAGDSLTLRARTFGEGAGTGTTYTFEGDVFPGGKTVVNGGTAVEVSLSKLPKGAHTITIRAARGTHRDAVTREVTVVDSYFSRQTHDLYEITPGLTISNEAIGDTTLTFNSGDRGKFYSLLQQLSCGCGLRLDQVMSRVVAIKLLNQYYGKEDSVPEVVMQKYQTNSGGLTLLPYSDTDLELSALSAHILTLSDSERDNLKNYLNVSLSDTKSDISRISRALFGLAALGQPVLSKIQALKNDKALDLNDRIYLALALDTLGAKEEARTYYVQKIAPNTSVRGSYAFINVGGDMGKTGSALVAALLASLDDPLADKFGLYAQENHPEETLSNFELLLYAKNALPRLKGEEIRVTYSVDGKEEYVALGAARYHSIRLSKSQLKTFKILSTNGSATLSASYEHLTSPSIVSQTGLGLGRSYDVDGMIGRTFEEGDLVRVMLIPRFGDRSIRGSYTITDYAPSGLRPTDDIRSSWYSYGHDRIYPTEIKGQQVTFVVTPETRSAIYYYARVVTKGTYLAEPALLQSVRDEDAAVITNEDTLIIR